MTHLKPAAIVDAAEGHASPEQQHHLETCQRCTELVQHALEMLGEVTAVVAPEPSPLYWEHLSQNIRDRIAEEPRRRRSSAWIWAPATVAVGAVAIVIGLSNSHVADPSRAVTPVSETAVVNPAEEEAEDSSWSLVTEASSDLAWDDVESAGFSVRPGAADHAAADLSEDQREELARLLSEELAKLKR